MTRPHLEACRLWVQAIKSNQHLVQFHGACLDQTPPMLIMELMAGGNLRHALSDDTLSPNLKWYRWAHLAPACLQHLPHMVGSCAPWCLCCGAHHVVQT